MKTEYYGHSFVKLTFSKFSVAIDPYGDIGLPLPKVFADYVFCTHNHYDHNNASIVKGAVLLNETDLSRLSGTFQTVKTFHDEKGGRLRGLNYAFIVNADGKKVVHLGDIGCFDENVVEKTRGADVMFIPVGGKYTIDARGALRYIEAVKPKTVIPIHYKINGSTVDIARIDEFLKLVKNYETENSGFVYSDVNYGVVVVTPEVKGV